MPTAASRPARSPNWSGGTASVTLRRMVPLGRSFAVLDTPDGLAVLDGAVPVATVRRATPFVVEPPVRPSFARAEEARLAYLFTGRRHALSDCVVCGPARPDGLHVMPGPVPYGPRHPRGAVRPARLTSPPTSCPPGVRVAGALDLRQLPRLGARGRPHCAARLPHRPPHPRHRGRRAACRGRLDRGVGTRSHRTASALLDEDGTVVASAHAVWVEVRHQWATRLAGRLL